MNNDKSCPCCGESKIVRDYRTKEVYCNHCGLILDDKVFIEDDHTWETSHEPLSDGLSLLAEMAKRERKANFTSQSKKWYENLKQNYYPLLLDKLLESNYSLGEAWDIFNYCFLKFYRLDIENNKPIIQSNGKKRQRRRAEVIDEFLDSLRFEAFDVSVTVSRLKIPKPIRSSWLP